MSILGAEQVILTVPDPALIGPSPDQIDVRSGTFVDIVSTNITAVTLNVTNLGVGNLLADAVNPVTPGIGVKIAGVLINDTPHYAIANHSVASFQGINPLSTDGVSIALSVAGNGAITAAIPTGATNVTRGINAVDFQINRAAATQVASGNFSAIVGGSSNTASGIGSVIGGGVLNTVSNQYSAVVAGSSNSAAGDTSFIGGGALGSASGQYSSIVGGTSNTAAGVGSAIGGGANNSVTGQYSAVVAGSSNTVAGDISVIGGGTLNSVAGRYSVVAGGNTNVIQAGPFLNEYNFIGGGRQNTILAGGATTTDYNIIVGGRSNVINTRGQDSVALGSNNSVSTSAGVSAVRSMCLGWNSISSAGSAITLGSNCVADQGNAICIGDGANSAATGQHVFRSKSIASNIPSASNSGVLTYDSIYFDPSEGPTGRIQMHTGPLSSSIRYWFDTQLTGTGADVSIAAIPMQYANGAFNATYQLVGTNTTVASSYARSWGTFRCTTSGGAVTTYGLNSQDQDSDFLGFTPTISGGVNAIISINWGVGVIARWSLVVEVYGVNRA